MSTKLCALFALVALVLVPAAGAQDGGLVNVLEVRTQLGQQQQYEAALGKLWEAFRKAGVTHPIFVSTSTTEPGTYTFVAPVTDLADLGGLQAKVNQAFASVPAVMNEIQAGSMGQDQSVWMLRPDLAYTPASPRLQDSEVGFTRIAFLRPHPSKIQELETALRDAVAMRKKHRLTTATSVGQLLIGPDGPAYAVLIAARDEADFHANNAKEVEMMGADWQAYLNRVGPLMRHVEFSGSTARPTLAYQP